MLLLKRRHYEHNVSHTGTIFYFCAFSLHLSFSWSGIYISKSGLFYRGVTSYVLFNVQCIIYCDILFLKAF